MLRWCKLPAHSRLGCAPGLRFDKSSGWRARALHPQLLRPFASTSPRLTLAMSLPSKMKAITIAKPGEVDVVEQTEMPVPEAQPGHVLIKVCTIFPKRWPKAERLAGRVRREQLHRHILPVRDGRNTDANWTLKRAPVMQKGPVPGGIPSYYRHGVLWHRCRSTHG
jgi:hypothetical protein